MKPFSTVSLLAWHCEHWFSELSWSLAFSATHTSRLIITHSAAVQSDNYCCGLFFLLPLLLSHHVWSLPGAARFHHPPITLICPQVRQQCTQEGTDMLKSPGVQLQRLMTLDRLCVKWTRQPVCIIIMFYNRLLLSLMAQFDVLRHFLLNVIYAPEKIHKF